jgi:hypothetical protein
MSIVVGHVPLEISKYCYHFIRHGGEIEGKVEDIRPRRSPIPSGGLEVKLNLTFTAEGPIMHMMRQFLRASYSWDYTGEQETVPVQQDEDDEEKYNF